MIPTPLKIGPGSRVFIGSRANVTTSAREKETTEMSYYISSIEDSKRIFRAIRDHWKIENQLHYMLDVYLGEDGWSKRAGEAAINMELMAKIDLFILQRLKAKLGKSIPRVQMFLAKINPLQLFELGL